jgi:hypothetical protein
LTPDERTKALRLAGKITGKGRAPA